MKTKTEWRKLREEYVAKGLYQIRYRTNTVTGEKVQVQTRFKRWFERRQQRKGTQLSWESDGLLWSFRYLHK